MMRRVLLPDAKHKQIRTLLKSGDHDSAQLRRRHVKFTSFLLLLRVQSLELAKIIIGLSLSEEIKTYFEPSEWLTSHVHSSMLTHISKQERPQLNGYSSSFKIT